MASLKQDDPPVEPVVDDNGPQATRGAPTWIRLIGTAFTLLTTAGIVIWGIYSISRPAEMMSPMLLSLLAEIEPTWAISLVVVVGLEAFFSSAIRA